LNYRFKVDEGIGSNITQQWAVQLGLDMALILSIWSQVNREGGKGDIQPEVLSILSEDDLDLNEVMFSPFSSKIISLILEFHFIIT